MTGRKPDLADSFTGRNYEIGAGQRAENNPQRAKFWAFTVPLFNRPDPAPVAVGAGTAGPDSVRPRPAQRYPLFIFQPTEYYLGPLPLRKVGRPQRAPYYVPRDRYDQGDLGYLLSLGNGG